MRFFRSREDSLKFWLSFFFLAGSVCGSLFCNQCDDTVKTELLQISQGVITEIFPANVDYPRLFAKILWKRGRGFLTLMFMLATPIEKRIRMAVMAYLGLVISVMICPLTMYAGVWGIWNYLCLNVPQGLFYMLIGYLLLWWMPLTGKRLTVGAITALGLIFLAGVAAETYINPYLLTFLFKI